MVAFEISLVEYSITSIALPISTEPVIVPEIEYPEGVGVAVEEGVDVALAVEVEVALGDADAGTDGTGFGAGG